MNFNEVVYKRINMKEVGVLVQSLTQQLENAKTEDVCFQILEDFNAIHVEVHNLYLYLLYRENRDRRDTFCREELTYFHKEYPILQNLDAHFYVQLLESPFLPAIEKKWGKKLLRIADNEALEVNPSLIENKQKHSQMITEYYHLRASMKVPIQGKEYTLQGINKFRTHIDRNLRKLGLDGFWKPIEENKEALDSIFRGIIQNYQAMAEKLGYKNYVELVYQRKQKYDYSAEDMARFRRQVAQYLVPIRNQLDEKQRKRMGYDTLYAYDLLEFKSGEAALKLDYENTVKAASKTLQLLSNETGQLFEDMVKGDWIDFLDSPHKKQGSNVTGFCVGFEIPFISLFFMGRSSDISTLFHEFGHAFQKNQTIEVARKWKDYFWATTETAEIHSFGMEYLVWDYYHLFTQEDTPKFQYHKLRRALAMIIGGCVEDEFQHYVYARSHADLNELSAVYRKINQTYYPNKNYDGNTFLENGEHWRSMVNIAFTPFSFVGYSLATICALQLWKKSQENFEEAWQDYLRLCKVGGSVGFKEALQIAHLKSPFEMGTLKEVVGFVEDWLNSVDTSEW